MVLGFRDLSEIPAGNVCVFEAPINTAESIRVFTHGVHFIKIWKISHQSFIAFDDDISAVMFSRIGRAVHIGATNDAVVRGNLVRSLTLVVDGHGRLGHQGFDFAVSLLHITLVNFTQDQEI